MKKSRFPSAREWIIAGGITLILGCAANLWVGDVVKPICTIERDPNAFIREVSRDLKNGRQVSKDELASRYSNGILSSLYTLTFSGQDNLLTLTFTPKSYDKGWGIHGSRFKYAFNTQTLKTRVYDEQGVCFYTQQ